MRILAILLTIFDNTYDVFNNHFYTPNDSLDLDTIDTRSTSIDDPDTSCKITNVDISLN